MLLQKPAPISGVSAGKEAVVQIVHPSVAATNFGRLLGILYDSIPVKIGGVKLSQILFALPTAPLGMVVYLWIKVFGAKYVLTNRSVQIMGSLTGRVIDQVALDKVANVRIRLEPGQAFYPAGDLYMVNAKGESLLVLPGVPWPDVFQHIILEARDARVLTESSLKTIGARH